MTLVPGVINLNSHDVSGRFYAVDLAAERRGLLELPARATRERPDERVAILLDGFLRTLVFASVT